MIPTTPTVSLLPALPSSRRLRPDVALYAAADGRQLLKIGDTHHHVRLDAADHDALLEALVHEREATTPAARAALAALVDAGLADAAPAVVTVVGDGTLATAVRRALARMGAPTGGDGTPVAAFDGPLPAGATPGHSACWVAGHRVMLSPPAVAPADVAARHLAATRHHAEDPDVAPLPDGPGVRAAASPLSGPGLELAAVHVAAEMLRPERPMNEAVVVDLVALAVTRHPVLPVPTEPR